MSLESIVQSVMRNSTQIMTESSMNTDVVGTPQIHTCGTCVAKHISTRVTWKTTTKGYDRNVA